jgi:hypothetical protein
MRFAKVFNVALVAGVAGLVPVQAGAAVTFNEFLINPGGADNGQEFIELIGTPGESLVGVTLVGIEGEGTTTLGIIDQAIPLSGALGTNGLALLQDSATERVPAPEAGTTVFTSDFLPDIENGTQTFLLVTGFSSATTTDLDTNDDGTLDSTPWTSVLAAFALRETEGAGNLSYAEQLGGVSLGPVDPLLVEAIVLDPDSGTYIGLDVAGTSPGPYTSTSTTVGTVPSYTLTPGSANTAVPEPAALALLAPAALLVGRRRRPRA